MSETKSPCCGVKPSENPDHKKMLSRLNRVQGQVAGISKMIEEGRYCVDILTQVAAVRGALSSIEKVVLEAHLKTCVQSAFGGNDEAVMEEKITELLDLFQSRLK